MTVALCSAVGVLLWQRWNWLALAAFAVSAPQLGDWVDNEYHRRLALVLVVLLGVLGAVRRRRARLRAAHARRTGCRTRRGFCFCLRAVHGGSRLRRPLGHRSRRAARSRGSSGSRSGTSCSGPSRCGRRSTARSGRSSSRSGSCSPRSRSRTRSAAGARRRLGGAGRPPLVPRAARERGAGAVRLGCAAAAHGRGGLRHAGVRARARLRGSAGRAAARARLAAARGDRARPRERGSRGVCAARAGPARRLVGGRRGARSGRARLPRLGRDRRPLGCVFRRHAPPGRAGRAVGLLDAARRRVARRRIVPRRQAAAARRPAAARPRRAEGLPLRPREPGADLPRALIHRPRTAAARQRVRLPARAPREREET